MDDINVKTLLQIPLKQVAIVQGFAPTPDLPQEEREVVLCRLLEMGIIPGAAIAVQHKAPFGGSPLAVTVNHNLVGIGLHESKLILVNQESTQ